MQPERSSNPIRRISGGSSTHFVIDSCDGAEAVANAFVAMGPGKYLPPAKARTARCAREQDRGGGSGVEGGYAVGLWPAFGPGFFGSATRSPMVRESQHKTNADVEIIFQTL